VLSDVSFFREPMRNCEISFLIYWLLGCWIFFYHFTGLSSTVHYQVLSKALVDIAKNLYICTVLRSMFAIEFEAPAERNI
jgi:hypothetical protein